MIGLKRLRDVCLSKKHNCSYVIAKLYNNNEQNMIQE